MELKEKYHPEKYWSTVGERIESRPDENVIAGDDEPFIDIKERNF